MDGLSILCFSNVLRTFPGQFLRKICKKTGLNPTGVESNPVDIMIKMMPRKIYSCHVEGHAERNLPVKAKVSIEFFLEV